MDTLLMKIPGVPGESRMKGYEGQIEILSFSHGTGERERGAGRPQGEEFVVTRHLDGTSQLLYQKCIEGADLGEVVLTVGRVDRGTVTSLVTYTLSNAVISSINMSGGGGDMPVETVFLKFSGIRWTFPDRRVDG